ncbi:DUF3703 domain-containing protein [Sphingopyxis sp. CCNWLW253]|uniref:DUF3703 domain-containing protein n=1 Tax=unclassified Sphingopyxis TaxID=2614943 RepID=UPI00301301C9
MSMSNRRDAAALIAVEMTQYRAARRDGDHPAAWNAIGRAHIVAQPFFALHLSAHWHMLGFAIVLRDGREVAGQLLRLALVPLGSLTGRLPIGNTGRARISAFLPMPVPPDLAKMISPHDKPVSR